MIPSLRPSPVRTGHPLTVGRSRWPLALLVSVLLALAMLIGLRALDWVSQEPARSVRVQLHQDVTAPRLEPPRTYRQPQEPGPDQEPSEIHRPGSSSSSRRNNP